MSIQSRFRTYKLYIPSTRDALGAKTNSVYVQDVDVSISLLTGSTALTGTLQAFESTHTGICYDTSIRFATGSTISDGLVTYAIKFANYDIGRTILYMKMVI